jgi:NADH-quinone oxidoreductase subunit G
MTNEELFMARRLAKSLGIPEKNIDIVPRTGEADAFLVSADKNPNTEGARNVLGIWTPGQHLPGIRDRVASGVIKSLIAWHEDLLDEAAGFTKEQLAPLQTIVYGGTMACDFADMADVVLPLSEPAEKRGSMINVTGRLQRLNKAVDAPGIAGEDWEVLRDITAAAGGGNGLYMLEDVFKTMVAEYEKLAGLTLGKIGDLGIQLYETGTKIPLLAKEAERKSKGLIVG